MTSARRALLIATLLLTVLIVAQRLDPLPEGLRITYFSDANWSSSPVESHIDSRPSTESLVEAWPAERPEAFSATWTGSFIALRDGSYTFGTRSDDGSWVYVDEQLVVDNGGQHSPVLATGAIRLHRGIHTIFIKYFQAGGPLHFDLLWARDQTSLALMPGWALSSYRATFSRFLISVVLRRTLRAALYLWLLSLVIVAVPVIRGWFRRWIARRNNDPIVTMLIWVIAASCIVNLTGIWWGFPVTWAGDEITPTAVLESLARRFSRGWFDRYPPFHYYVLSAAYSPWLLLRSLGWIDVSGRMQDGVLTIMARMVSVAAGAGTLVAVFLSGAGGFGKRAGLFAAGMAALLTPFVYYAKTANPEVPYVFWFAVSLVFYLRLFRTLALRDFVLFASAGTLAICTKDQAYGLYLSAPFAIVHRLWESNRHRRLSHPFGRALVDVRLLVAGAAAAAVFVASHNILLNPGGFVQHVQDITGAGSQPYRMVERTLAGQLELLRLTVRLDQVSWGWPFWVISLLGMIVAVKEPASRRAAIYLVLVIAGYYLSFIDVILYVYDRYLLPVCVLQALFGGLALDRFLHETHPARRWRQVLVVGAFAYTLLYAATVDVLMIRDSRNTVEDWLRVHAGPNRLVATAFPSTVLPRLEGFRTEDIGTIELLRQEKPDYYVLNADYAQAILKDRPPAPLVEGLKGQALGYRLVFRYRSPAPWPWLPFAHPDLVGRRLETHVLSVLRDLNPTIEIYARDGT